MPQRGGVTMGWMANLSSTLLLTLLIAVGLVFFLRAASKDRTTTVEVRSSRPPLEVLSQRSLQSPLPPERKVA